MDGFVWLLALACVVSGLSAVSGGAASPVGTPFRITSTLDRKRVLPLRIRWIAHPSLSPVRVLEVDFLVDDRKLWVEHNPPYTYGDDGNYLVTSFLKPGRHRFTVTGRARDGWSASDTVVARVLQAPAPPTALVGTWKGFRPAGGVPAGYWRLVIGRAGWEILEPPRPRPEGSRVDVAYLSPGLLEVRTGMATGHPHFDLNGWCRGAPGSPAGYRWSVEGAHLELSFVSGKACPRFTDFITGPWTRVP